jgi:hypothetical protein
MTDPVIKEIGDLGIEREENGIVIGEIMSWLKTKMRK